MTEIRPITEDDFDAVAEVHVRTWRAAYAGIIPDDYLAGLDVAALAERRRQQVATAPPGAQIVVAVDSRVIGFAAFGPNRDEPGHGELYAIYVEPGHWGSGAGRLLIEAAKAGLAAFGFPDMRLWVFEENHRARRFYALAGLAPDGARQGWTPPGSTIELPELRYATDL